MLSLIPTFMPCFCSLYQRREINMDYQSALVSVIPEFYQTCCVCRMFSTNKTLKMSLRYEVDLDLMMIIT